MRRAISRACLPAATLPDPGWGCSARINRNGDAGTLAVGAMTMPARMVVPNAAAAAWVWRWRPSRRNDPQVAADAPGGVALERASHQSARIGRTNSGVDDRQQVSSKVFGRVRQ
jgi:hypothetical protein